MAQEDIRKIFSHIHLLPRFGYITLGFSIGNSYALAGAFLHLIGHVFMKKAAFLQFSLQSDTDLGNSRALEFPGSKKMPITSALIVLGLY